MTAGDVVERIKKNLGVPWRDTTYRDTFKFGGPDTAVTGIATTVFCSFEVLRRASAAGCNMIIPHEVTYWSDRDDVSIVSGDPLYTTKVDFMRKNNMVVFRIHDHMHAQRPDFTYVGSARDVGLDAKYETAPNSHRFIVPETTLGALAAEVRRHTGARALRVVGNPDAMVSRIQLGVGYATPPVHNPEIDVVISGEQQETDGTLGQPRVRARRDRARHQQGLDHAGARDLRGGRHAGDGAMDPRVYPGSAGATRQGRRAVLGSEVTRPHC